MGIFVSINCFAMAPNETEELYNLCQNWFQDSHIKTIASHIVQLQQRKGSQMGNRGTIEVQSPKAKAKFNVQDQIVTIYRVEFPQVIWPEPVASIQFNEVLKIKDLIELKNKK